MGRRSTFTHELAERVLDGLKAGLSMSKVCEPEDMPAQGTVDLWCRANPEFAEQFAQARARGWQAVADGILDIADTAVDKDSAAAARVRVDARLKVLAQMMPRVWGPKVQLDVNVQAVADRLGRARQRAIEEGE